MDKSTLFQIFGIGIAGAIGNIILKKMGKEEIAIVLDIGIVVLVMLIVINKVKDVLNSIMTMFGV